MKSNTLILFLLSLVFVLLAKQSLGVKIKCFYINNGINVYNLSPLRTTGNDNQLKIEGQGALIYNICGETLAKNPNSPGQVYFRTLSEKLINEAGLADVGGKWSLLDPTNPMKGLVIDLPEGQLCRNNDNYKLRLEISCSKDPDTPSGVIKFTEPINFDYTACSNVLKARSFNACPDQTTYELLNFINQFHYLFGIAFILVGLFILLWGLKMYDLTIFGIACIIASSLTLIILFQVFVTNDQDAIIKWVVFSISIVIGVIVGYFMLKLDKVFFLALGGFLGFIISEALLPFVLVLFPKINPVTILWVIRVLGITSLALTAFFLSDIILIIATTIIGASAIVYGFSLYWVPFPNLAEMIDYLKNKEFDQATNLLEWQHYLYTLVFMLIVLLGMRYQFRLHKHLGEKKNDIERDPVYRRVG